MMAPPEISIITCACNPDLTPFERMLAAVERCVSVADFPCEYCIVDNNSNPPLRDRKVVRAFLTRNSWATIRREKRPGLSFARAAGVGATSGNIVVFFDDDNAPFDDYLVQAAALMAANPGVFCWGPGWVNVEFIAPNVHPWIATQKKLFQERRIAFTKLARGPSDFDSMPYGTGMVVQRDALNDYIAGLRRGRFSMTGRHGRRLSSGEDLQIVYTIMHSGGKVGVSPALRIRHLVSATKSTPGHVIRLAHGMWSSYQQTYNEVFIEHPEPFFGVSSLDLMKRLRWAYLSRNPNGCYWDLMLRLTKVIATVSGCHRAFPERKKALLLRAIEQLIF